MATLVCTLETVPTPFDQLAPEIRRELMRWTFGKALTPEAFASAEAGVKAQLPYSPLTASCAVLGLYDVERGESVMYYVDAAETEAPDTPFKPRTEAGLLRDFWAGAPSYDTFVSFNGRHFLLPFLLGRSAAHRITPSVALPFERNLSRQGVVQHIDLLDQLTFAGMTRRHTLYHYCHTFGLPLPNVPEISSGLIVEGRMREAADVVAETLHATIELYAHWREYFAGLNTIT